MLELYLPFLIGLALGMEPTGPGGATEALAAEIAEGMTAESPAGPEAAAPAREPEPQVATGQFTTALEVRPILGMTQGNWVAVRDYNGQDLVYFTHLLSWRCGLWEIRYGLNGAAPDQVWEMEPCHEGTNAPNAQSDSAYLPYIAQPAGSVQSVTVELTYDDGETETASFERAQILMP